MKVILQFLVLALLLFMLQASPGNKQFEFQGCVHRCTKDCTYKKLDAYLRLLLWNCDSNCKYKCMMSITEKRIKNKNKILQYYGKWPFKRYLGMQEPASVLFSFLNLFGVLFGWRRYMMSIPASYDFYKLIHFQTTVNSIVWLSATIYHTRDYKWTELFDYLGATAAITVSMFNCIARFIGKVNNKWVYGSACGLFLFFCGHSYKLVKKINYGYNMKVMLTLAFLNVLLWLLWCYKHYKRRRYVWKCSFLMLLTAFLGVLEVFDFPPLFSIFDGHSLWHLGTVPIAYYWYSFLIDDAKYELERKSMYIS